MKFKLAAIAAAVMVAGAASADPYGAWRGGDTSIVDSFKKETTSTITSSFQQDNDVTKSHSEDNDVSITKSEDNDYTKSEDNDVAVTKVHTEDNDYTNTEDNDYTSSYSSFSEVVKPELNSFKLQSQKAGHEASAYTTGYASGHDVSTSGSRNDVAVGNKQSFVAGPQFTNVNQYNPQTALVSNASVAGGVDLHSTQVAGDMQTIMMGPIGETTSLVGGDVGQASSSLIGQTGDSANSIADPMNVAITR